MANVSLSLLSLILLVITINNNCCSIYAFSFGSTRSSTTTSSTSLKMSTNNIDSMSYQSNRLESRLLSKSKKLTTTMSTTRREPIRMPSNTPMVPYKAPDADYYQFIDINSAMYRSRTLMISQFIDEEAANSIISIILYLRKENPDDEMFIYFNVPGAHLRPALAIYDLLQQTKQFCRINTVNLGLCTGMGAFLCASGTKGYRSAMPNSRFLLHRTGMDNVFQGQATDIGLEVKNVKTWNDRMENELSILTGQTTERIHDDLKRDFYLSSEEAVRYGLIDQVLLPSPAKRASAARVDGADLGAFEGTDEQRYQGENSKEGGGWGSQQQQQQKPPEEKKKQGMWKDDDDDDDDGPKIAKGG